MREILQQQGINICCSPFGKQLGEGLFEFRLREDGLLLRVFCHAYGNKIVLLLSGYDKGESPGYRVERSNGFGGPRHRETVYLGVEVHQHLAALIAAGQLSGASR
jgi:hypothetical protein